MGHLDNIFTKKKQTNKDDHKTITYSLRLLSSTDQ